MQSYPHQIATPDAALAGTRAGADVIVSAHSVYPVHTRFGVIVWNADIGGKTVHSASTFAEVIKGLAKSVKPGSEQ